MKNLLCILLLALNMSLKAQVSINTDGSLPDSSAMLDVKSTNKGFLPPRMTTVQRNAIASPEEGLLVFNVTTGCIEYYLGGSWKSMCGTTEPVFQCGMKMTDARDGRSYNTVKIGSQCWMAENLDIGLRIDSTVSQTNNDTIEKYCFHDDEAYCSIYGGLYAWNEVMQYSTLPGIQGICPSGWHIPNSAEFSVLTDFLGGDGVGGLAGDKMKETGSIHWDLPNTGTNQSGFTALGAGWGDFYWDNHYWDLKVNTQFWSSTEHDPTAAYNLYVGEDHGDGSVGQGWWFKNYRVSVRCVKN